MNIIERLISAYPQDDVSHQDANPWYYVMGVVCLFFSVRGLVQYLQLQAKHSKEQL